MAKLLFIFLFFFLGKMTSAQAKATAMASATILYSVGAEDLQADGLNNTASFTAITMQTANQNQRPPAIEEIPFTTFRIAGSAFVYSLSLTPDRKEVPQQAMAKKGLTDFTVKPSATRDETFILSSRINEQDARKGKYPDHTAVEITVHFN